VIKLFSFRLAEGCAPEDFLNADKAMQQEFSYQQPGLLRRTTAKNSDGEWLVLELWSTEDAADQADSKSGDDPHARRLNELIDPSTARTARYLERR